MSDLLLVNGEARQLVANPHYTILFEPNSAVFQSGTIMAKSQEKVPNSVLLIQRDGTKTFNLKTWFKRFRQKPKREYEIDMETMLTG